MGKAEIASNLQADQVKAYWADRGYRINVWVERHAKHTDGYPVFAVCTDLVNGCPQRGPIRGSLAA